MSEVKKFKSPICHSDYEFSVENERAGVRVSISGEGDYMNMFIAPSDAPALMQAIGECLPPIPETVRDGSYEAFMAVALEYLVKAVRALEAETAEAKEQAELEAEALELCDSARLANGRFKIGNFGLMKDAEKTTWLAVARRAREINKEEK